MNKLFRAKNVTPVSYFYFEIKFAKFISSKKWLVLSAVSNDKVQESMFDIRDKLAKLCSGILFH